MFFRKYPMVLIKSLDYNLSHFYYGRDDRLMPMMIFCIPSCTSRSHGLYRLFRSVRCESLVVRYIEPFFAYLPEARKGMKTMRAISIFSSKIIQALCFCRPILYRKSLPSFPDRAGRSILTLKELIRRRQEPAPT